MLVTDTVAGGGVVVDIVDDRDELPIEVLPICSGEKKIFLIHKVTDRRIQQYNVSNTAMHFKRWCIENHKIDTPPLKAISI